MRKGFDGLSGLVRNEFKADPLLGDVFVFLSRTKNRIKILHWQGDGFAIYSKRLEKGAFELPKEWLPNVLLRLPDTKTSELINLLPSNWKKQ